MPEVRGRRRDSPRKDEPPSKRIRGSDSSRSPGSSSSHRNGSSSSSSPRYNSRREESSSSGSRYSSRSSRTEDSSRTRRDSERSSRNRRSPHRSKKDSPRQSESRSSRHPESSSSSSSRNSPRSSSRGRKEEIDAKSAREKRQANRERIQKEDETKKTDTPTDVDSPILKENADSAIDTIGSDEYAKTTELLEHPGDNSMLPADLIPTEDQNGDAKSTDDDDIPDLEECPPERGISPAADISDKRISTPTKTTPADTSDDKILTQKEPEITHSVATGDSGTAVMHTEPPPSSPEPPKKIKKLSELAAKKSEPPKPPAEALPPPIPPPVESNPLDTVPKPETKSTKPGAKIEEIFAKLDEKKLEEASKLKPSSPKEVVKYAPDTEKHETNKILPKTKEVASVEEQAATIMTSMAKKTTTVQKTPSDAILSKLIGKQITKVDDNALQFDDEMVDESERITGSDLALPFDSVVGPEMVVGSEVCHIILFSLFFFDIFSS